MSRTSGSQWAVYEFQTYREGMEPLGVDEPPAITLVREPFGILLISWASIEIGPDSHIGLSAVIEEVDGTKSYWALRHPAGPPDFHHPDCFALTLPAPGGA
jgi:hypothetical protein